MVILKLVMKLVRRLKKKKNLYVKYTISFLLFFIWYSLADIGDLKFESKIQPKNLPKLVCALYVGSYANDITDGYFNLWNKSEGWHSRKNPKIPPYEISTSLFPKLGVYSSHEESLIRAHFSMMKECGINSVILMWDGHNHSNNKFTDETLEIMYKNANDFDLKIGILIQSYDGRTNETVFNDIKYFVDHYRERKETLKIEGKPFVIIYEPFYIPNFFRVIEKCRESSKYDCFFVSTILSNEQIGNLNEDGFDAVFTYFASESFKPPSEIKYWQDIQERCNERGIGFSVAVAPGYHEKNSNWIFNINRKRDDGEYYDNMWQSAIEADVKIVIINSFNNWLEGTNIEPAVKRPGFSFDVDLWHSQSDDPDFYLQKTKNWIDIFYNRV